jgi:hypothetical protein
MKTHMGFWQHLERNSTNIWRSQKSFRTEVVDKYDADTVCPTICPCLSFPLRTQRYLVQHKIWGSDQCMLGKSSSRKILVGKIRLGERGRLSPPRPYKIHFGHWTLTQYWVSDAASFSSTWVNSRCVYPRIFNIFSVRGGEKKNSLLYLVTVNRV